MPRSKYAQRLRIQLQARSVGAGVLSARPTGAERLSVAICCYVATPRNRDHGRSAVPHARVSTTETTEPRTAEPRTAEPRTAEPINHRTTEPKKPPKPRTPRTIRTSGSDFDGTRFGYDQHYVRRPRRSTAPLTASRHATAPREQQRNRAPGLNYVSWTQTTSPGSGNSSPLAARRSSLCNDLHRHNAPRPPQPRYHVMS